VRNFCTAHDFEVNLCNSYPVRYVMAIIFALFCFCVCIPFDVATNHEITLSWMPLAVSTGIILGSGGPQIGQRLEKLLTQICQVDQRRCQAVEPKKDVSGTATNHDENKKKPHKRSDTHDKVHKSTDDKTLDHMLLKIIGINIFCSAYYPV
jgi:hypothetical protein